MIPVTGIDFGTSYSCFCVRNETGNSFLSPDDDSPLIPSCISMTDRDIHLGWASVKDALRDNFLAFREFKPYIGHTMKEIVVGRRKHYRMTLTVSLIPIYMANNVRLGK